MANTLGNWTYHGKHVDPTIHPYDFVGSKNFLIAAAPPRFDMLSGNDSVMVDPIGVCQQFQVAEAREVVPLYEIGSDIPYIVPGRVADSATFADVLVKGRNLIKKLFAYYHTEDGQIDESKLKKVLQDDDAANYVIDSMKKDGFSPGNNYYYNLRSPILSLPVGIVVIMVSKFGKLIEAFMLEEAYVTDTGFAVSGGTQIIADQVPVRFSRIIPLSVEAVKDYQYE